MTIQPGANLYTAGFGTRPEGVEVPVFSTRSPAATDVNYPLGKRWINTTLDLVFDLTSFVSFNKSTTATWTLLGSAAGALDTLTTDDATVVVPTAGTVVITGATNELTTTGANGPGTVTVALANNVITPGAVTVSGLLTASASAVIDTAGTALDIATDVDNAAVNIATAGVRTTIVGSTTTTSATTIRAGSGGITLTGAVTASNIVDVTSYVRASSVFADGDQGTGFASTTAMTNVVNTTQGAGSLSILSTNANSGSNKGFLKFYVGTTVVYVPYFDNIAP